MKKKKRLKKSVKIFLFLLIILLIVVGFSLLQNESSNNIDKNKTTTNETTSNDSIEVKTYLNNITYSTSNTLKAGEKEILIKFMDMYFRSMHKLETEDITILFNNFEQAYLNYSAIDLVVESRLLQDEDLRFEKGYYDLDITKIKRSENETTITFLENDTFKFKFLNKTSHAYDIKSTIVLEKEDNGYKIKSFDKIQDYFVMFTRIYKIGQTNEEKIKASLDDLKNDYLLDAKEVLDIDKKNINYQEKSCDNPYDRERAVNYSYQYITSRNKDYYAYDNEGGNCQNYASQSIIAGGIPMDDKWYYKTNKNKTATFTAVPYFYNYVRDKKGKGLCGDVDVSLRYAEKGDVIQVGYDKVYRHTTLVSDNVDGIILLNSNTINLKDYPLMLYTYPNHRLIKILGYN